MSLSNQDLNKIIELGKKCAVQITGFPEDADEITDFMSAYGVIKAALNLGIQRNNELNELNMKNMYNAYQYRYSLT